MSSGVQLFGAGLCLWATGLETNHAFALCHCVCGLLVRMKSCSGSIGNVMVIISGPRLDMPVIFGKRRGQNGFSVTCLSRKRLVGSPYYIRYYTSTKKKKLTDSKEGGPATSTVHARWYYHNLHSKKRILLQQRSQQ